jgi:hypothetical protein
MTLRPFSEGNKSGRFTASNRAEASWGVVVATSPAAIKEDTMVRRETSICSCVGEEGVLVAGEIVVVVKALQLQREAMAKKRDVVLMVASTSRVKWIVG